MRAYRHARFAVEVTLTPAMVAAYAAAGDTNPVHHDPTFAATTRYRRLIASGTHTTALLLGLTASHSSQHGAMVGLEFWVRVTPNARLKGDIVELRGRILGHNGVTALGAKGKMFVTAQLEMWDGPRAARYPERCLGRAPGPLSRRPWRLAAPGKLASPLSRNGPSPRAGPRAACPVGSHR